MQFSEQSDIDYNTKAFIPNIEVKNDKDLNSFDYRMENLWNTNNKCDEIEKLDGMPHHTRKSYGYRNPEEHYFSYIDANTNSTLVEPWGPRGGDSVRLHNKEYNRIKYKI